MSVLPAHYLRGVVAIGRSDEFNVVDCQASGFLLACHTDILVQDRATGRTIGQEHELYLVTNRHVLDRLDTVIMRFNHAEAGPATEIPLTLLDASGNRRWMAHPNQGIDVAIMPLGTAVMNARDVIRSEYRFISDFYSLDTSNARHLGVSEGSIVYVLGFPFGLAGVDRNYVIARSGIVARIQDLYDGERTDFAIDGTIFKGNSGGPVMVKLEESDDWRGEASVQCWLVGVVKSFDPHFGENSHLAYVEPIDHVREAIQIYRQTGGQGNDAGGSSNG